MSSEKSIDELSHKLDVIIRLLAYQLVSDKTLTHAAPILKRIGLSANEIAAVFDTTATTVHVRLSESRKGKRLKERD
jgi:hypothetical protein